MHVGGDQLIAQLPDFLIAGRRAGVSISPTGAATSEQDSTDSWKPLLKAKDSEAGMLPACRFWRRLIKAAEHPQGPCIEHSPGPQRHLQKIALAGPKVAG